MAFTFFFRDYHTIEKAIEFLLPQVAGFKKIKIWDAGCAHGPEPYTFTISLSEKMNHYSFNNVQVDASDIDETDTFGKIITEGIYPYHELQRIPEDIFKKYFSKADENNHFKISENIRSKVHFKKHNLLTLQPYDRGYHLIIIKNVLLHFQPSERIEVIKMFHSVLADNGLMMTEQTQPLPDECKSLFEKMAPDANIFRKIG